MGRPFNQELSEIEQTYISAKSLNVEELVHFIKTTNNSPVLAVGSGGSFAVAIAFALLIQDLGGFAKAITPYELYMEKENLHRSSVIIFSAGGSNPDILSSYEYIKQRNVLRDYVVCMKKNSPIVSLMKEYEDYNYFETEMHCGKDGFLAVNSTILALSLLHRVQEELLNLSAYELNDTFKVPEHVDLSDVEGQTLITLGGNWAAPVLYDFESKCTEAGLVNVQVANYRNFAHGRHHWIARYPHKTKVVCFVSPKEREIAQKTLKLIPDDIPKVVITTNYDGIAATLDLMVKMFYLVNSIGIKVNVDPGRPHVPMFGRKLYHLKYNLVRTDEVIKQNAANLKDRAIARKINNLTTTFEREKLYNYYKSGYEKYIKRLKKAAFDGLVFDYDNTIIHDNDVHSNIFANNIEKIIEILKHNIPIGFATGRGISIKTQLQDIIPECLHEFIWIGYYNGGLITKFNEPINLEIMNTNKELEQIYQEILGNCFFNGSELTFRPSQITIVTDSVTVNDYKEFIDELIASKKFNLKISLSDHSIDIIPKTVSKINLLREMSSAGAHDILCIGDSGDLNGNDFELLNTDYSLSVDRVSLSNTTCWNLSSLCNSGPKATTEYLNNLEYRDNKVIFKKSFFK